VIPKKIFGDPIAGKKNIELRVKIVMHLFGFAQKRCVKNTTP